MDNTLDSVLETISHLGADAQRELRAQLARMDVRDLRGGVSTREQYVWDALCEVVGGRHAPPLSSYAKSYGVAKFKARLEMVNDYLDQSIRTNLSDTQRRAVAKAVLQCLHARLTRASVKGFGPAGYHKVMLDHMNSLHDAVEEAFPGYSEAGLLDRVVLMAA